jgi:hypothetical protein
MIKALALIILLLSIFTFFFSFPILILSILLLTLQILLVFEYRKFKPFSLLLLFVLPYTLVAFFHFIDSSFPLHLGSRNDFDLERLYIGTFVILCLFWSSFSLVLPRINKPIIINNFLIFNNKPFIFYFLLILQIIILVFGRSGNTIFESGGYGSSDMNTSNLGGTAIFEYFIVFYPVTYIFSGRNKFRVFLLILLAVFYSLKAILFGGRVEFLQCILLIFILHFDNPNTSLFRILVVSFIPLVFFILFGFIRSAPDSMFDVFNIVKENIQFAGYTFFGNQIDVYYSSTRLLGLIDINLISIIDRFEIFLYNIFAIISPYSLLPEKANLALYLQGDFSAGGGGLLPVFFYVYLSYFGVIIVGLIMGYLFYRAIKLNSKVSQYWVIYLIMILSTYPRWYAYSSNVIYKFCIYSLVIFGLLNFWLSIIYKINKK